MVKFASESAIVVSDVCGQRGGAYRVTSLLCEALSDLGFATTCYASWVEPDFRVPGNRWRIVRPYVRRGSRWDVPHRMIAWQAARAIVRQRPAIAICIGLTKLCEFLLNTSAAPWVYVWELTNAEAGNKFVSDRAVKNLTNCRGILSPAEVIDEAIRKNYSYDRPIHRLPFWIEPVSFGYLSPPATFSCDFLFLSRREQDKGLGDLLEAAAILGRKTRNFKLLIAGPGGTEPWASMAAASGIGDILQFASLPTRENAMTTLRDARFVVLPSWHEGFPISILESAKRSVPLICTEVGAIPEMLGYMGAALYHTVKNADSLADRMRESLEMDEASYTISRKAIRARYDVMAAKETLIQRLLTLRVKVVC